MTLVTPLFLALFVNADDASGAIASDILEEGGNEMRSKAPGQIKIIRMRPDEDCTCILLVTQMYVMDLNGGKIE